MAAEMKVVENDGIVAAIVNNGRVLLLKRSAFPFMLHPGHWSFVSGGRKRGESHIETAYREIREETGMPKQEIEPVVKNVSIMVVHHNRKVKWPNKFFIFRSKGRRVRLNIEHSACKWVRPAEIQKERFSIINSIESRQPVLNMIKRAASRTINKH